MPRRRPSRVFYPNRIELIRLFRDLIIDPHAASVMETLTLRVQASSFMIVDMAGEVDDDATEMFKRAWFYDLMRYIVEARFFRLLDR